MKSWKLLCLLLLAGCSDFGFDGYEITGQLENANGGYIYLDELTSSSILPRDSALINGDGNFLMKGQIEEIGFYRLRIAQNNFVNIVLNKDDKLKLIGDVQNLYGSYKIEGSKDANLLYEFNDFNRKFGMKTDSLRRLAATYNRSPNSDSLNIIINNAYTILLNDKRNYAKQFVSDNSSSITALAAVESLDSEKELKLFIKLDRDLYALYPELGYVKSFHARVAQLSKLAVGSEAPQIVLNDPAGNKVPLASLRGKVVLVDFWASWCKPCRFENPNVVRMYNKFKEKGFEIYGVSLDKNKAAWVQAIKQDNLKWTHVSDLGFWNSAAVKLYDIKSIPQTYLLDEYGIIIGKGLRGKALEKKLEEVLGAGVGFPDIPVVGNAG